MAQRAADSGLYRKLVWINLFRVVTVTVLLGGTVVVSWQSPGGPEGALSQLYLVVIATYVLTIAFSVALRLRLLLTAVAYGQILLDVGIAAVVARLTGGIESVFLFMFSLAVVNGAILLYRRGAITAAALAVVGYLLTVATAPGPPLRAETLFAHSTAFILTAALALLPGRPAPDHRLRAWPPFTGLYQSIIQSMTSGLATLDPAGRVTYLNPAGEAMAGLSLVKIRNQPAALVFPAFQAATGRGEVEHLGPGGQRMLLGYSSFPLVGPRSHRLGTAVIFQDLTRLRAMEEAMAPQRPAGGPGRRGGRPGPRAAQPARLHLRLRGAAPGAGGAGRRGRTPDGDRAARDGAARPAGERLPPVLPAGPPQARAGRPGGPPLRDPGRLRPRPGGGGGSR